MLNSTAKRDYARAKQTAAYYQISVSSLWNWTKNRKGFPQPLKAGERVTLFDLGAIDAYLKSEGGGK
jgi:predicted DNA-binding transcriptional regulator AlpA